jgi:hypothetical protein
MPTQEKGTPYKGAGSMPRWLSDGPAKTVDFSPNASYYPTWYNPKATHGGTASLAVDIPPWDIVEHTRMAAVFVYQFNPACPGWPGQFYAATQRRRQEVAQVNSTHGTHNIYLKMVKEKNTAIAGGFLWHFRCQDPL